MPEFGVYKTSRAARPAIPAIPLIATVAMGYAAPVELSLAPAAAEVALPKADEALDNRDDMPPVMLEMADAADSLMELSASEAELAMELASLARDSLTPPLEKRVVLPRVVVMVLPSVMMVDTISEVVIAPAAPVTEVSDPVVVAVWAGSLTVPDSVTAEVAAPELAKEPVEASGLAQYAAAYAMIGERSVPEGQDWVEQSRTP